MPARASYLCPMLPTPQPTLNTARLRLRPPTAGDAPDIQRYASDRDVAAMTLTIPHPYPDGAAEQWVGTLAGRYADGTNVQFAIVERDASSFVGSIGLVIEVGHNRAELGYWIGRPFWGRGYATEA